MKRPKKPAVRMVYRSLSILTLFYRTVSGIYATGALGIFAVRLGKMI